MRNNLINYLLGIFLGASATLVLCTSCLAPPRLSVEPTILAVVEDVWDEAQFNLVVDALKTQCPLNADVRLVVRNVPNYWGYTIWNEEEEYYEIHLHARQAMHSLLYTLVHEWAHAMVLDMQGAQHGPLWGVAWAQCYRALISTFGGAQLETEGGDASFRLRGRVGVQFLE